MMLLTPCRSHVRHLGGQKIPLRFESTTSTLLIGTVEHLFVVRDPMTRPRYHEDVEENKNKQQRDDNDEPEKLTTYGHFGCLLQPAPCPVPTESGRGRILAFVMFVNQFLFPVLPHRLAFQSRNHHLQVGFTTNWPGVRVRKFTLSNFASTPHPLQPTL